jgi:hypothetical protein
MTAVLKRARLGLSQADARFYQVLDYKAAAAHAAEKFSPGMQEFYCPRLAMAQTFHDGRKRAGAIIRFLDHVATL